MGPLSNYWNKFSRTHIGTAAYSLLSCLALACSGAGTEASDIASDIAPAAAQSELIGGTEFTAAQAAQMGVIAIKDTCTAALVGKRHILTAAHCAMSIPFVFGGNIKIAQTGKLTANTAWTTVTVKTTHTHPGWYANCLIYECRDSMAMLPPYAPDLAIVELTADVPASFKLAKIPRMVVGTGKDVWVTGYGCEVKVGGAEPNPPRLKAKMTKTLAASKINDYRAEVPPEIVWQFNNSNILTPGIGASASAASLCPGDSGGPLLESTDPDDGPTFPRNWVLGVNAYYVFKDNTGKSVRNLHARLWDNGPTQAWLLSILPATSFVTP